MAAYHIRIIGGFVIWSLRRFKGSIKDSMSNYVLAFLVGALTVLIVFILSIYLYGTC